MPKRKQPIDLDTDVVEKLGAVLTALKIQHVKVRTLTFDIGPDWGPRHRVRITASSRARWDRDISLTSIERI